MRYRRQLDWPATLVIELFCERLGTSSLTIAYRIADAGDRGVIYADGNTVMVWIDRATGRPVNDQTNLRSLPSRPGRTKSGTRSPGFRESAGVIRSTGRKMVGAVGIEPTTPPV